MSEAEDIRWCTDTGIAVLHIDTDGRVLMLGNSRADREQTRFRLLAASPGDEVAASSMSG